MSEEVQESLETTEESHEEPEVQQTDWKAEARKWEARAKENKSAADELAALKEAQMSEQEKLTARAEAAEKELESLKMANEREQLIKKLSAEHDVPEDLLRLCADEAAMETFCKVYQEQTHIPAAPSAPKSKLVTGSKAKVSNRDQFAADVQKYLS